MMNVGILGCGPAGLLAAWAVTEAGHHPVIFSIKKKSRQYGAQWLHEEIPGITDEEPDGQVEYIFKGDVEGYAEKVYNNVSQDVSWGKFGDVQPCWDLRAAYNELWYEFEEQIINTEINRDFLKQAIFDAEVSMDQWISTIPQHVICTNPFSHSFTGQPIWAGVTNKHTHPVMAVENTVVYNGDPEDHWYRAAWVFGKGTVEYPFVTGEDPPDIPNFWKIMKPIDTDCDCWDGYMLRVGRFGEWKKGVLSHHAYFKTLEYIEALA